jgi:hypothetical protein
MKFITVFFFGAVFAAPQIEDLQHPVFGQPPLSGQLLPGVISCDMREIVDRKCIDLAKKAECTQCVMNMIRLRCQHEDQLGKAHLPGDELNKTVGERKDILDKKDESIRKDDSLKKDDVLRKEDSLRKDDSIKSDDSFKKDDSIKKDDSMKSDDSIRKDDSLRKDDSVRKDDWMKKDDEMKERVCLKMRQCVATLDIQC